MIYGFQCLNSIIIKDESDLETLDVLRHNVLNAEDMIDLVWYLTLMLKGVQSLYRQHNMKLDCSGKQFLRIPLVS